MAIAITTKHVVEIYFNGIKQEGITNVEVTANVNELSTVTITKYLMPNDRVIIGSEIYEHQTESGSDRAAD